MARNEVGRVETHLDDLDNELTSRLAENVCAKTAVEPDTLIVSAASKRSDDSQSTKPCWFRRA